MIMYHITTKTIDAIHNYLDKHFESFSGILAFFGLQFHFETLSTHTIQLFKFFGYTIEVGSNQNDIVMYSLKCMISAFFAVGVAIITHYIKNGLTITRQKKRRNQRKDK